MRTHHEIFVAFMVIFSPLRSFMFLHTFKGRRGYLSSFLSLSELKCVLVKGTWIRGEEEEENELDRYVMQFGSAAT